MRVALTNQGCGAYILRKGEKIVYVGRSSHIPSRLGGHADKEYDSVEFMFCDMKESIELERKLIIEHQPIYNKQLTNSSTKGVLRKRRSKDKKQIGSYVPTDLLDAIKSDAIKFRKTMDGVTEVALEFFFQLPNEERQKLCSRLPNKIFGRSL